MRSCTGSIRWSLSLSNSPSSMSARVLDSMWWLVGHFLHREPKVQTLNFDWINMFLCLACMKIHVQKENGNKKIRCLPHRSILKSYRGGTVSGSTWRASLIIGPLEGSILFAVAGGSRSARKASIILAISASQDEQWGTYDNRRFRHRRKRNTRAMRNRSKPVCIKSEQPKPPRQKKE